MKPVADLRIFKYKIKMKSLNLLSSTRYFLQLIYSSNLFLSFKVRQCNDTTTVIIEKKQWHNNPNRTKYDAKSIDHRVSSVVRTSFHQVSHIVDNSTSKLDSAQKDLKEWGTHVSVDNEEKCDPGKRDMEEGFTPVDTVKNATVIG